MGWRSTWTRKWTMSKGYDFGYVPGQDDAHCGAAAAYFKLTSSSTVVTPNSGSSSEEDELMHTAGGSPPWTPWTPNEERFFALLYPSIP